MVMGTRGSMAYLKEKLISALACYWQIMLSRVIV